MLLYDLKAGTNPRRVRIFLAEKGVTVPKVEVDMMTGENKKPDYLAKNPLGRMPLLELDDGTLIAESMAICRYFESLHPEPPLFGTGAVEIAKVEMWNRRMELEIMRPIGDAFEHLSPFWKGRRRASAPNTASWRARLRWIAWPGSTASLRKGPTSRARITRSPTSPRNARCVLGKNTGTPIPDELSHLRALVLAGNVPADARGRERSTCRNFLKPQLVTRASSVSTNQRTTPCAMFVTKRALKPAKTDAGRSGAAGRCFVRRRSIGAAGVGRERSGCGAEAAGRRQLRVTPQTSRANAIFRPSEPIGSRDRRRLRRSLDAPIPASRRNWPSTKIRAICSWSASPEIS